MQDPVCTPEGYLFSKEAIVENLLQQKKAIKRKLAAWESQQADDQQKAGCIVTTLHSRQAMMLTSACAVLSIFPVSFLIYS